MSIEFYTPPPKKKLLYPQNKFLATPLAAIGCKLKQNANEGCNSCASLEVLQDSFLCFIARFILLVIAP